MLVSITIFAMTAVGLRGVLGLTGRLPAAEVSAHVAPPAWGSAP